MNFYDVVRNLVRLTHHSSGQAAIDEAIAAVDEHERDHRALVDDLLPGDLDPGDVSRETKPATPATEEAGDGTVG